MDNPTLTLIHQHASVRHFKPDPVPMPLLETVIAAAQCAATSSNMQAFSVIAVLDQELRNQLSMLAADQAFIRQAPVFLVWCADLARLDRACEMRGYTQVTEYLENFLVPLIDTSLAAQNAALASESLGLGVCFVGALRENLPGVIELLTLPKLVVPIFGLSIGWPSKAARIKPRLPLVSILHIDHYDRTHEDAGLRSYDQTMATTGIYTNRQVLSPGKTQNMEDYSWTEHTARRISRPTRTAVRQVVEDQGFTLM